MFGACASGSRPYVASESATRSSRSGARPARAPTLVLQLRIPVLAAALGRGVENDPERHEVGSAAGILAGVCRLHRHLAAPEMTNRAVAAREDVVRGVILGPGALGMVVAVERVARGRVELQVPPATLFLERDQAVDGRFGDDRESDTLLDVGELAVP